MENRLRRIKSGSGERGNAIIEFGLVAMFLAPILAGAFTLGMTLVKGIQAGNVCHDANILQVRGVDLSSGSLSHNERLTVRAAQGFNIGDSNDDPLTSGPGAVILTKGVLCRTAGMQQRCAPHSIRGPALEHRQLPELSFLCFHQPHCDRQWHRIPEPNRNPNPNPPTNSNGTINDQTMATNTADQISNFPSAMNLTLQEDQYTFLSEAYFDISYLITAPVLHVRNLS